MLSSENLSQDTCMKRTVTAEMFYCGDLSAPKWCICVAPNSCQQKPSIVGFHMTSLKFKLKNYRSYLMTYFRKFCYLNISCIRKSITLTLMSFAKNKFTLLQQNSVTDVSVGFRPPVGAHPGEQQHGVSLQIFISLGKTFLRISRIRNIPLT